MDKKIILLLFLLLPFAYSYEVNLDDFYVNEYLKIDANFNGADVDANALCNFFIINDQNFIIDRLTDEYMIDNNHVYSVDYLLTEPPLFRGDTFTVKVICQGIEKTNTFTLLNRRGIGLTTEKEIQALFDNSNTDTILILLFVGALGLLFFVGIYWFTKMRGGIFG